LVPGGNLDVDIVTPGNHRRLQHSEDTEHAGYASQGHGVQRERGKARADLQLVHQQTFEFEYPSQCYGLKTA
jgi:hypothetical protein